jgi:hypothetical protein
MDGYIFSRFASPFSSDLRVAGSAVVARNLCEQVVWTFGPFVHYIDKSISAARTVVCRSGELGRRRRWGFAKCGETFGAFLRIGGRSQEERHCAQARDEKRFAIDRFHIRIFPFILFSAGLPGRTYRTLRLQKTR